ncbi:MAG: hypothetical protein AB1349_00565 [Elusimicrobiota bacterium]
MKKLQIADCRLQIGRNWNWNWKRMSLRALAWQSRFWVLLFTFLPFHLSTCLYGQDMKVKLNSADGSTSFQVRDSADVVVSSITSDGNIHTKYGVKAATESITGLSSVSRSSVTYEIVAASASFTATGTYSIITSSGISLPAGGLKDLTVKNEDLIITSTFVYVANTSGLAERTWTDTVPFYGTLNITQQPAMIYAVFTTSCCRTDSGYPKFEWQILGNGCGLSWNVMGYSGGQLQAANYTGWSWLVTCVGVKRVTQTGTLTVKVQDQHWGNMNLSESNFSAFWFPCGP